MRVEAVHDRLNEGRATVVACSPQGFVGRLIDRKRVAPIHNHSRKAIGTRFLVDGDRGLRRQRRGDGNPIVVTEEDDRNMVERGEVGSTMKVRGRGRPVAKVGEAHRVVTLHPFTGSKPHGVRQMVADEDRRQHRVVCQEVRGNLVLLDAVQPLKEGGARDPAGECGPPGPEIPEDPIVGR